MKALPEIPESVPSALGPVPIVYVPDLLSRAGEPAMGLWCPEERVIKLRPGMHPVAAWHTLYHEQAHVVMWDGGAHLPYKTEEHVCDLFATARLQELMASVP